MGGFVLCSYLRSKRTWELYAKEAPTYPGCRAVLYLVHIVIIYLFIHPTWTSRVLFHKHIFEGFFFTSPPFRCWSFQDQASSFSKIYQNWKASNTAAAV